MIYRLLADAVFILHALYLVYLTLGGFLAWFRPWALLPHAVAVLWGVAVVVFSIECPLTGWENALLAAGGEETYDGSFIGRYLGDIIYPGEHLADLRWPVAALVAVSWAGALRVVISRRNPR